ncbi:glycosyltransferase family 2 protein [Thiomicrorhabdus cannonii]|uniref:glycosyltransferase family 2 protein n=1 Tax=Thiomicrorhabdus cannonii TaxID=2748011 RepID=UPI0015BB345C|nr:glycosyltransferase [Thiomicrorhabdus cannonii]
MQNKGIKPVLFIITPSYNRPELLDRAINSVIKQHYPNWRLYIVDDGSQPETLLRLYDIERLDQRIKVYFLPKNQGVNFVRNFALNRIMETGQNGYIIFLDDDDQLAEESLLAITSVIKTHPKIDWFVGNCVDLSGKLITKIKVYGEGNYINDYLFSSRLRRDAMHVISTGAIGKHRFSQEFRNSEEWIWFLNIAKETDFYSINQNWKQVDYQETGLSAKKVNDDKKLRVLQIKEQLSQDLKPVYLAEQRMLLAREYFKKQAIKLGMRKLIQAFPLMWYVPKWHQILLLGIFKWALVWKK